MDCLSEDVWFRNRIRNCAFRRAQRGCVRRDRKWSTSSILRLVNTGLRGYQAADYRSDTRRGSVGWRRGHGCMYRIAIEGQRDAA